MWPPAVWAIRAIRHPHALAAVLVLTLLGVIVIGAQQDLGLLVPLAQLSGHWGHVARVEAHGHRKARRLKQRGGGGIALGHQDDADRHAQHEEVALLHQSGRPELLLQALAPTLGLATPDDLQSVDVARGVHHRDHHGPGLGVAHAVATHGLTVQVLAVAIGAVLAPRGGRTHGRALGVSLAGQLGALFVLCQALAQAVTLLGRQVLLAQLDLGGVVLVATPHAIAADYQVGAVVQAHLVQVVPAAAFAVTVHLAPTQASHLQGVDCQACGPQLGEHVIVVGRQFSNSQAH